MDEVFLNMYVYLKIQSLHRSLRDIQFCLIHKNQDSETLLQFDNINVRLWLTMEFLQRCKIL